MREQADPGEVRESGEQERKRELKQELTEGRKRVTAVGKFYGQATKGVRGDA